MIWIFARSLSVGICYNAECVRTVSLILSISQNGFIKCWMLVNAAIGMIFSHLFSGLMEEKKRNTHSPKQRRRQRRVYRYLLHFRFIFHTYFSISADFSLPLRRNARPNRSKKLETHTFSTFISDWLNVSVNSFFILLYSVSYLFCARWKIPGIILYILIWLKMQKIVQCYNSAALKKCAHAKLKWSQ